jgi:transposase-like protein
MNRNEPPLFAEELDIIIERVTAGESFRSIARRLDRSKAAVSKHARRMGLSSKTDWKCGGKIAYLEKRAEIIREQLAAGASYCRVGRLIGVNSKTIWKHARRLGLRSVHGPTGNFPNNGLPIPASSDEGEHGG